MKPEVERRAVVGLEVRSDEGKPSIRGYAAVFN